MEYLELITQIIEVEHTARRMADEAKAELNTIDEILEKERVDLRESYFERARHRVEMINERENAAADEMVERLKKKCDDELAEADRIFAQRREIWAEKIFLMVIGNQG